MKEVIWRAVGRWLVVPPAFVLGLVFGYIFLNFSFLFERACITWTRSLTLSPGSLIEVLDLARFVLALAIWGTAIAWTVGFALRTKQAPRFQWGLTLALLLGAAYLWTKHSPGSATFRHVAAGSGVAILVGGVISSFRANHSLRTHFLANALTLTVLMLPGVVLIASTPNLPPTARRLWSTVLDKNTWQGMNTGSSYNATRQVAFARGRIIAVFDAGLPTYDGKQPVSKYRLLSLDARTGQIKDSREMVGPWGTMPYLFATDDGLVVLDDRKTLKALNPDLTEAEPHFTQDRGRVGRIPPGGSMLVCETDPGTTWLGSSEVYVNNETVMVLSCGGMRMFSHGTILKEAPIPAGRSSLAGFSQNGQRFALQFSDEKGDPSILLYEYFIIFDVATLTPLTTVRISDMPERQSWSAFSPDGRYFVAGNPDNLSLYQVQ